jgi:serine protease Do
MIHLLNVEEWAERYHNQDLSPEELKQLHQVLEEDAVLNNAFEQALKLQVLFQEHKKKARLKSKLALAAQEHRAKIEAEKPAATATVPMKATSALMKIRRYWKPLAAVASIALCSSILTYTFTKETTAKKNEYVLLRKEVENIKRSQNQIISNLKQSEPAAEVAIPKEVFSGSGFAISNDGYFTTNYHVVEKADSIYLQMNDGRYFKASIIKVDPAADLAIVKVEDENFSFKHPIPYTIDNKVAMLGQRIYSIGYPKEEVVYNEGYVSSEKGFEGNVLAYQLEMTANPGQSGAPILDTKGNVVGIVTGKQNNTAGTTYAVHAEQLIKMIAELPKGMKVNLNTKNKFGDKTSRPEQVKLLKEYVCSVKVY